jgi:hypothetical protein
MARFYPEDEFSQMSITTYQTAWYHNPGDHNMKNCYTIFTPFASLAKFPL